MSIANTFKKLWRPLVAILLVFVLIKKGPFQIEQIQFVLSQYKVLLVGLTLLLLQFVVFSFRWSFFVHLLVPLRFAKAFELTMIGQFFSFFIPGGVGGDVIKALELSRKESISKSETLSTVLADRILSLFAMILMSAIFLVYEYTQQPTVHIKRFMVFNLLLLLFVSTGLFLAPLILKKLEFLFKNKSSFILIKLEKIISSFHMTFEVFRNVKFQIKNFFICVVIQSISIYFLYYVIQTLGLEPPSFLIFFSFCCFGFLASAIPITPAGIGVGQAAFYFLFSLFSPELGQAAVTAVSVLQLFYLFYAIVGGIIFSIQPKRDTLTKITQEAL